MTKALKSRDRMETLGRPATLLPSRPVQTSMEETGPFAIEVDNLVKQYPGVPFPAVAGISFRVRTGEIFGLLGPNGAGKTTTIGILTTMIRPTSGRVLVAGCDVRHDPVTVKKNIAVIPQFSNLDRSLSPRENLLFHAAYFGVPRAVRMQRANELMEQLGLKDWKQQNLRRFSGGMAQRVMIARALMTDPAILFLDEPTVGLDPQSRLFLWDKIAEANAHGVTIVLTTHDMEEADRLCHRVGIIDHGQLLVLDTPSVLKNMVPGGSRLEVRIAPCDRDVLAAFLQRLQRLRGVERVEVVERQHEHHSHEEGELIRLYTSAQDLSTKIINAGRSAGVILRELRLARPSLENLFIFLTGRELRT
jgi:ABC-2 type transport system ATP-binding protein